MKKHLSVISLFARATLWKLAAIYAAGAAIQCALFYICLISGAADSLEAILVRARTALVGGAVFMAQMLILCSFGCDSGAKTSYTLKRLRVSEWSFYFMQALYNMCCCFILWCVQLAVTRLLCVAYMHLASAGEQEVFLACYRSDYLHSLLPLDERSRYLRNVALIVCLGHTTAYFPVCRRGGVFPVMSVLTIAVTPVLFSSAMGKWSTDVLVILGSVYFAVSSIFGVRKRRWERDA